MSSPATPNRRLLLRVLLKLLFGFGLLMFAWVLFGSLSRTEQGIPVRAQLLLDGIEPGAVLRYNHAGRPLLILHRSIAQQHALDPTDPLLLDPASRWSQQPDDLPLPDRSYQPQWLVVVDQAGELGCPLELVEAGNPDAPHQPWPGGLRERCRGSWYDLAGRAYSGEHALRNLSVPAYRIEGEQLLLE